MSKPIKLTEVYLEELRRDFEKALALTKLSDGKLNFTKTFTIADRKATIYFTAEAWTKMVLLIKDFDKEVAWHGVARRADDENVDEYIISDILVYPQEVSGATVEMDTEKYALWLMENADDERFDNIHMQGHSHVNMPVSASAVDINHQEEILEMLGDEDFYIFMIWNKSFVCNNKIYDLKKNVLFENADVTVKLIGGSEDLDTFLQQAKDLVKTKSYSYKPSTPSGKVSTYGNPYNPTTYQPSTPAKTEKVETKPVDKDDKPRSRIDESWWNNDQQSLYGGSRYYGY